MTYEEYQKLPVSFFGDVVFSTWSALLKAGYILDIEKLAEKFTINGKHGDISLCCYNLLEDCCIGVILFTGDKINIYASCGSLICKGTYLGDGQALGENGKMYESSNEIVFTKEFKYEDESETHPF